MDAEKELDEVLAALARLQISGLQQFTEAKRRFLMLVRDDKAAAVAAERERWRDVRRLALRALVAWDETVLPQANDGMMQECMEDLRAAVLLPASVSQQPCQTTQERT